MFQLKRHQLRIDHHARALILSALDVIMRLQLRLTPHKQLLQHCVLVEVLAPLQIDILPQREDPSLEWVSHLILIS